MNIFKARRLFPVITQPVFQSSQIDYLFFDDFSTPAAAPLTTPRTAEPGPGTGVITDSGNHLSISGGCLGASSSVATRDPIYNPESELTTQAGTCAIWKIKQTAAFKRLMVYFNPTGQSFGISGNSITVMSMADAGAFDDTDWHYLYYLTWGDYLVAIKDSTVLMIGDYTMNARPAVCANTNTDNGWLCDYLAVVNLPAPWSTPFGIATDYAASPSSGEAITQEADGLVYFEWTCATGETLEIMVRRTDDDNCWILRCDQAAGTMKLIKKEGGAETEVDSESKTFYNTGLHTFVILMYGSIIRVHTPNYGSKQLDYASASFNQTATGVKASGFASGAKLASLPRTLTGQALSVLQKHAP